LDQDRERGQATDRRRHRYTVGASEDTVATNANSYNLQEQEYSKTVSYHSAAATLLQPPKNRNFKKY
jgi:hypothetical protein